MNHKYEYRMIIKLAYYLQSMSNLTMSEWFSIAFFDLLKEMEEK